MNAIPKVVYTANAQTGEADAWTLGGEFAAVKNGEKEILCILRKGKRSTVLPKRCVFDSERAALDALDLSV